MSLKHKFPPLPDCHIHTKRYTPHVDKITSPEHVEAQLSFWSEYMETDRSWEMELPDNLHWRHSQIVGCILVVLKRRITLFSASNCDLFELCMLQQGWDSLMIDIENYFAQPFPNYNPSQPGYSSLFGKPSLSENLSYISNYAQIDCTTLSHLYDHPPPIVQQNMEWGQDPTRPPIVNLKLQEERCLSLTEIGPILTSLDDVPDHRCEVPGCRGAWWFWTALRRHQGEIPHKMIRKWCEGDEGIDTVEIT